MVVIDDAAVRADGDVDASFLKIFVALGTHVNERGRLPAPNSFSLTCNTDRTAADADLDKVRACVCKETESLAVNDIARTDFDRITVLLADVLNGHALPLGESLGGVDAKNIYTRGNEGRDAIRIIARINAGADNVAFIIVRQLKLIFLVVRIVLAKDHIAQTLILVNQREHIQFALPDEIVCLCKTSRVRICPDKFLKGCHEGADLCIERHARDTVVTARHDADEFSVRCSILRDCHRGVPGLCEEIEHAAKTCCGTDIGIAADKAGLIVFHTRDHRRLCFDGLGTIDERNAPLFGKCDRHRIVGDCLHDCRCQRYIHRELRFLIAMKLDQRCAK